MKGRLYILTGASGCGKTTLLNSVAALNEDTVDPTMRAVRAPKYSERPVRIKQGEVDDITHVSHIQRGDYDIAYVINNVRYGIKTAPIWDLLNKNLNPFLIVSDVGVVKQLKQLFGQSAVALYVSSAIDAARLRRIQMERLGFSPTAEQKAVLAYHFARTSAAARLGWWDRVSECMSELESDWHLYATDARSTEIRAQKIRAFHIRYIEYIHLFDFVVLNYSENNASEMTQQVRNIICQIDNRDRFKAKRFPPLFVVAAASGAGKGTLMEMLHFIGGDRIRVTSKLAKRSAKAEDRRDGMIALNRRANEASPEFPEWWTHTMKEHGALGEFPMEYDLRWEFHRRAGSPASGVAYAVCSKEINCNIEAGMPQILVSNIGEIGRFREEWPENTVFVYLHRLLSAQDNREFQTRKWKSEPAAAEVRIAEKEEVHRAFVENIAEFDHVLLNTAYQEDLYDQMFRLLEFYEHSSEEEIGRESKKQNSRRQTNPVTDVM